MKYQKLWLKIALDYNKTRVFHIVAMPLSDKTVLIVSWHSARFNPQQYMYRWQADVLEQEEGAGSVLSHHQYRPEFDRLNQCPDIGCILKIQPILKFNFFK